MMKNSKYVDIWGARFKEIRMVYSETKTSFGNTIGLSPQRISQIERTPVPRISKKVFDKLVKFYHINPHYLQGYPIQPRYMFHQPTMNPDPIEVEKYWDKINSIDKLV